MIDCPMDFLVEAYETTGRIICDVCFEDHCEEQANDD